MKRFEVKLRILNKQNSDTWSFYWEGGTKLAKYEYTSLYIEAESKEKVMDIISDNAKGSLKILSINEITAKDMDTVNTYVVLAKDIYNPMDIIENIAYRGIGISNN